MVEILSLGGTYPQLALEPGFNCLFVFEQGNTWYARMVASGRREGPCHSPKPVSEILSDHELSIKRVEFNPTDLPAVARWEWDVKSNTQVIGFRCLDGWCEAGERGHDPDTGPGLTSTMSGIAGLAGTPVLQVKGWYDEQRLSPAKSGWWKPGKGPLSVVGTIVPVPGLDRLDAARFRQLAAYRVRQFECTVGGIRQGQRFVPMTPAGKVTTISFCMEDWGGPNPLPPVKGARTFHCGPKGREMCHGACGPDHPLVGQDYPGGQRAAQILVHRPSKRASRRSCARHGAVAVVADDETTWGRCGGACCAGH